MFKSTLFTLLRTGLSDEVKDWMSEASDGFAEIKEHFLSILAE